jgi:tetratricopeptide (TPR) repeat protein
MWTFHQILAAVPCAVTLEQVLQALAVLGALLVVCALLFAAVWFLNRGRPRALEAGEGAYAAGFYPEALQYLLRALEQAQGRAPDDSIRLKTVELLGKTYLALGKLDDAEPFLKQWLASLKQFRGPNDPDVAACCTELGLLCKRRGNSTAAEAYYRRALDVWQKANAHGLSRDAHPLELQRVGYALGNLASLCYELGRLDEAELLLKRALALWERLYGTVGSAAANARTNLVNLYLERGNYSAAEAEYRHYLEALERQGRTNLPELEAALNDLALVCEAQGKSAEGEQFLQRALAIRRERARAAGTVTEVGTDQDSQFRLEHRRRGPAWRGPLAVKEQLLGRDYLVLAADLIALGNLALAQGRHDEAEQFYRRALALHERMAGPDRTVVADCVNNLGVVFLVRGQYSDARLLLEQARAAYERDFGPSHPDVADCLNNLAVLCHKQGDHAQAEPLLRESLAIREELLGPDHLDLGQSWMNLGALCTEMGKNAEARPLCQRALAILEKALGPWHPDLAEALNLLGAVCRALGLEDEAQALLRRSRALREKSADGGRTEACGTSVGEDRLQVAPDKLVPEPDWDRSGGGTTG